MVVPITLSRRRLLAASACCGAGTLAGCLATESGDDGGLPMQVTVEMMSQPQPQFEPRLVHIAVGGTVEWKLHSGDHDATAYHPDTHGPLRIPETAESWASPELTAVGSTYERTFEAEGVYDYVDTTAVCIAHEVVGSVGRIIVGWPDYDPETEPALREPQEELPNVARSRIADLNEQTREILTEEPPGDQ
ncbi:halocyanin [Natrarchaeobius chitinivorans]|uniref:Halocyanin n=1 Tax=Natrarchaeobius chitinivorans TaxID=1679083 RepID=A0A3N6MAP2_NATCH|nr:halocyanin [Natrarchaeobius chitinivorans]RQG90676.1 halocyanin [Natrarchaeobius chitinivorans]